jgi:hypothetical protein
MTANVCAKKETGQGVIPTPSQPRLIPERQPDYRGTAFHCRHGVPEDKRCQACEA